MSFCLQRLCFKNFDDVLQKKPAKNIAKNLLLENFKVVPKEFKLERIAFLRLFNATKIIKTIKDCLKLFIQINLVFLKFSLFKANYCIAVINSSFAHCGKSSKFSRQCFGRHLSNQF